MNNIYTQALEVQNNISRLSGYSVANYDIVRGQEMLLESMAVKALIYPTIKDIVNSCGLSVKRLASSEISKQTTKVLTRYDAGNIQLINLFSFTNEVYGEIKELPTVTKICGDPANEADYSVNEVNRGRFMNGLAHFVARQILLFKRQLSEIVNEKVARATDLWCEAYDGKKGTFVAFHQIANKLRDGGLEPAEAKDALTEVSQAKVSELAAFLRENFGGGYLSEAAGTVRRNTLARKRNVLA
ncbi:hypothetical protein [Brevibacillus agri]|uniref:hypothetical protein n=1 Tax=Brevibacillus agri TaxID=51101 RepID=UPI001EE4EF67|nr:hypothetical protein [Brevibacillus agri]MCG5252567.1 hypothetical protein [Brevibacillus agri]